MTRQHTDIIEFIKGDVAASKVTSRGRLGVLFSYVLVPAWYLWQLGFFESFSSQAGLSALVHFGAVLAFMILGVGFFVSLGTARFIRTGLWATAVGTGMVFGFAYFGHMAAAGFELFPPTVDDWVYAWICAQTGLAVGMSSAALMLLSLFVFGPFPTARHQLAIASLSSSLGLFVLGLYCPMGDVFHLSVGHLGQFAGLFIVTWLLTRMLCHFVLSRKIAITRKYALD